MSEPAAQIIAATGEVGNGIGHDSFKPTAIAILVDAAIGVGGNGANSVTYPMQLRG
jgi:hypothetical protein